MILKLEFKKSIKSSSVRHRTNTVVCPRRKRFVWWQKPVPKILTNEQF